MKLKLALCLTSIALTAAAGGDDHKKQPQPATGGSGSEHSAAMAMPGEEKGTGGAGMMDMEKMGPWTRKPTDAGKTKKEIQAFLKEEDKVMKSGDMEAALNRIDFPIYMATDNSKGEPYGQPWSREEYTKMMKPMYEQMPADASAKHKQDITVLSDSMALVKDDFSMTAGGKTHKGQNFSLLVKRDGQWKWKMTAEAGWGDAGNAQGTGGAGEEGSMEPAQPMDDPAMPAGDAPMNAPAPKPEEESQPEKPDQDLY